MDRNSSGKGCYAQKHFLLGRKKKIIFDLDKIQDFISYGPQFNTKGLLRSKSNQTQASKKNSR